MNMRHPLINEHAERLVRRIRKKAAESQDAHESGGWKSISQEQMQMSCQIQAPEPNLSATFQRDNATH